MYKVIFTPSVEKDFRSIPKPFSTTILKKVQALATDPIPYNSVKLTGTDNLYRVRVGDYRVVYSVGHEVKEVFVQYIRHRREVYRGL